ncbi:MAG: hypothetical protein RR989_09675, partial [Ruthenibacterium sp.]
LYARPSVAICLCVGWLLLRKPLSQQFFTQCFKVHFVNFLNCIKVFKKIKGMPPGAFRRKTTIEGAIHEKN